MNPSNSCCLRHISTLARANGQNIKELLHIWAHCHYCLILPDSEILMTYWMIGWGERHQKKKAWLEINKYQEVLLSFITCCKEKNLQNRQISFCHSHCTVNSTRIDCLWQNNTIILLFTPSYYAHVSVGPDLILHFPKSMSWVGLGIKILLF